MANPALKPDRAMEPEEGEAGSPYIARVVKSAAYEPAPGHTLNNFKLTPFHVPGRLPPGLSREELRLRELEQKLAEEKAKAQALTVQAGIDKAAAERAGFARGLAEGEKKAGTLHRAELEKLRQAYQRIVDDLMEQKQRLFKTFEEDALRLVMTCVRKLFRHIADEHEEAVMPVVREAVASLGKAHALVVKVNPEDLPLVEAGITDWLPMQADAEGVRLVADPRIKRAGCLVESEGASTGLDHHAVADAMEAALRKAHLDMDPDGEDESPHHVGA